MRGADKLAEPVDGVPLLHLQCQRALSTGYQVFVALPSSEHPRLDLIRGLPVTPLFVRDAAEGISGTLRGAVKMLPKGDVLVFLGDLAEVEAEDLNTICNARVAHPNAKIWRAATAEGKPGHPVLFHQSTRPMFEDITGDNGGEAIVKSLKQQTVLVPLFGNRARRDLDTPEDWAAFRAETGR